MPNDELRLDDPSEEPEQGEEAVVARRWWSPARLLRGLLRVLSFGFYGRVRKTPEPDEHATGLSDDAPLAEESSEEPGPRSSRSIKDAVIGLVLVGVGVVLGGVLVELESGRDELPAIDAAPVEPAEPEPSVADVAPANPDLTSPPVGASIGAATSRTELSERARELVPRMKIPGAIFILGPPSWAVTRADLEWSEPSAALTLLWANGACTPVTVHFNAAGEVISWDRGDALCFADEYQLVPGEEFSCSQADRAPLCGQ